MARMLAKVHPVQCSICRNPYGLDRIDVGRSKRQVKRAERDETRREAELVMFDRCP